MEDPLNATMTSPLQSTASLSPATVTLLVQSTDGLSPAVLYEGHLEKKGFAGALGRSKYWCRLTENKLSFYTKEDKNVPEKTNIDVGQVQSVLSGQGTTFEIVTQSKTHTFTAASLDVRENWVTAIRAAMSGRRPSMVPTPSFDESPEGILSTDGDAVFPENSENVKSQKTPSKHKPFSFSSLTPWKNNYSIKSVSTEEKIPSSPKPKLPKQCEVVKEYEEVAATVSESNSLAAREHNKVSNTKESLTTGVYEEVIPVAAEYEEVILKPVKECPQPPVENLSSSQYEEVQPFKSRDPVVPKVQSVLEYEEASTVNLDILSTVSPSQPPVIEQAGHQTSEVQELGERLIVADKTSASQSSVSTIMSPPTKPPRVNNEDNYSNTHSTPHSGSIGLNGSDHPTEAIYSIALAVRKSTVDSIPGEKENDSNIVTPSPTLKRVELPVMNPPEKFISQVTPSVQFPEPPLPDHEPPPPSTPLPDQEPPPPLPDHEPPPPPTPLQEPSKVTSPSRQTPPTPLNRSPSEVPPKPAAKPLKPVVQRRIKLSDSLSSPSCDVTSPLTLSPPPSALDTLVISVDYTRPPPIPDLPNCPAVTPNGFRDVHALIADSVSTSMPPSENRQASSSNAVDALRQFLSGMD